MVVYSVILWGSGVLGLVKVDSVICIDCSCSVI